MRFAAKNDPEYSRQRLECILNRRRIRFNPYKVSDKQLLEYAWQGRWGEPDDLTQMVIITFTRLREINNGREFDGIYFRVGRDEEEFFLARYSFRRPQTAHDTLRGVRHTYGKAIIRTDDDIRRLVGKTVFISRTIPCSRQDYKYGSCYRMHKITGNLARDAAMMRQAMCEAKIEMLERLMANPESQWYLNCDKGLIDYETPIKALIAKIQQYHLTPVPPSE